MRTHRGAILAPGVLLGVGLGGFLDGIVLHQILQWHNLVSSVHPPVDLVSMKVNMLWDGLFHAFTWTMTAAGIALLWRAGRRGDVPWSTRLFVGALCLGWGGFNVVEGLIDHQLLQLHHVHPGRSELAWDIGFLLVSAALAGVGAWLVAPRRRRDTLLPRREPLTH